MTWQPATELDHVVLTEEALALFRVDVINRMGWTQGRSASEGDLLERLASSPNKLFVNLGKEYTEKRHLARTLPVLRPLLVELKATWRFINYGFQFKFPSGTLLCWWPRTGSIDWQGQKFETGASIGNDVVLALEAAKPFLGDAPVTSAAKPLSPARAVPTAIEPTCDVLACLVCGEAHVAQTCPVCRREQTDLCVVCFPRAHWCAEEGTL